MVKKHLFQYGDSQFHILQLKTPRHLQRLKCHSQAEVSEQSQGADGCTLLATRVNQKQGFLGVFCTNSKSDLQNELPAVNSSMKGPVECKIPSPVLSSSNMCL